jgi:Fe2+ or Zn2+ uptake regulation protein
VSERLTNQKYIILDFLKNTKSHPSAEEVFWAVRKKLPQISLGTVYRNLEIFVQKNIVREISTTIKRFDADLNIHHHFICSHCNKIFDLEEIKIDKKNIITKTSSIGTINNYNFFVYGICKKCKK